jgi:DNA-binding MarR family transcriptional regulator
VISLDKALEETRRLELEFLGKRPEKSASFKEIVNELYEPNPRPVSILLRAINQLEAEGLVEGYRAEYEGRIQRHFRLK